MCYRFHHHSSVFVDTQATLLMCNRLSAAAAVGRDKRPFDLLTSPGAPPFFILYFRAQKNLKMLQSDWRFRVCMAVARNDDVPVKIDLSVLGFTLQRSLSAVCFRRFRVTLQTDCQNKIKRRLCIPDKCRQPCIFPPVILKTSRRERTWKLREYGTCIHV